MALQLGKMMELARHRSVNPGTRFGFRPDHDYPLLDAPCTETASFLFKHACDSNLLSQSNMDQVLITFKGWEYLENAAGSQGAPSRAFVAMSFDPQLASAYDDGIKPALEQDCGLTCIRMDRVEHSDNICDKILADIRRCHLMVADFTLQRPGVYFEAGFALALNRTVIWTVREDEMKKVHFDTSHYNHVVSKDPQDLRAKLANRIHATAPPARA